MDGLFAGTSPFLLCDDAASLALKENPAWWSLCRNVWEPGAAECQGELSREALGRSQQQNGTELPAGSVLMLMLLLLPLLAGDFLQGRRDLGSRLK